MKINISNKKTFTKALLFSFAAIAPLATIPVNSFAASQNQKLNALPFANSNEFIVSQTIELDNLTIPEGGKIIGIDGKSVTMTIDGIATQISQGTYKGKIMLALTDPIIVKYHDLEPHNFRTAIYVNDGNIINSKSVKSAILSGEINNNGAKNVKINAIDEKFNGFLIDGNSKYVIDNIDIDLTGNGGNDFAGFGAAIASSGKSEVVVNKAKIKTKGAIRTAIFVGGHSIMHVNDSDIEVANGQLPSDYKFTIEVGKMMEVPWMLGLSGNVRATNLVDHGTVYYNNTRIRAQGWGALSTDDAAVVRMYVKNSIIETLDSGYGAYSIGDSIDHFSASTLNVADIGLIMAGPGSGVFTDGTIVNSKRFGVMMHSGGGGGTLTIDKGSVFNTRLTAIQDKGLGTNIIIDNAKINAGNGIILQAMENDDPFMKKMMSGQIVGMQGPPPGMADEKPASPHVVLNVKNTILNGDFINSRTKQGDMNITIENATVAGAITNAIATPATGVEPDVNTYWLIGSVNNEYVQSKDKFGSNLTIAENGVWVPTKTSYLNNINIDKTAIIRAPEGYKISMSVNGKTTKLKSGKYSGDIVVKVMPLN